MILRALFWITVVGVLMPHQPDLGLGRPGPNAVPPLPAPVAGWLDSTIGAPQRVCADHAQSCQTALEMVDTLQRAAVRGLIEVKTEIEKNRRERVLRAGNG